MKGNILCGPIPAGAVNRTDHSLGLLLYKRLKEHGTEVAQIDGVTGKQQRFCDILLSSCLLAHNLKARGLRTNEVLSICSENRLEFAIPVIATLYNGVICAPLNPMYTKDELIHSLNITKPKFIFCSENTLSTICDAVKRCHFVTEIVLFGNKSPESSANYKLTLFSDFIRPMYPALRSDDFRPHEFDSHHQTAVVLCSSGTTGLPKGVKLSHANLKAFVRTSNGRYGLNFTEKRVIMGLVPFFHGYGYGMIINSIMYGVKVIILPKFEEHLFLSTIEKYKISVLPMVPPLMVFLAKHPLVNKYDLSSVQNMFCGAAPCGEDIINQVKKRLGFNFVRQAYGMTELSIAITICPEGSEKPNSVGKLVEEAQAKVIDIETGKAVGANVVGELCFRGPQVMQGYCNNERATWETIDSEGWLHTGDIGYYDEDEFFYIVDRLKELIKYKAYQVAPAELEALILSHPGVKDVAVIGVPDERCGELPFAFVVKQSTFDICENDVVEYVASRVSSQKRLRGGVRFIDVIPKNPSGKILRRVLRNSLKSKL